MNKLFTKIATLVLGMTMAVGVGVAVGSGVKASEVRADDTYTIGWGAASGDESKNFTDTSGTVAGLLTFECAKNGSQTTPAYNSNNNDCRLYVGQNSSNGNSITITPANNVTITSFDLWSTTTPSVKYKVGTGTATSVSVSSNHYIVSKLTVTSSNSLTIQNVTTGSNTQLRMKTIVFTYTTSGGGGGGGDTYEKVTSSPTDWSGEYVLVHENGSTAHVWTGVDTESCYVGATITDSKIACPEGATPITITSTTGGYSIKVNGGTNNGKYISGTSGSNALNFGTTAVANSISISNNSADIVSNTSHLRFNTDRFRYYKSATYSQSDVIQLYKKASAQVQAGVGAAWATDKGTYYNGAAAGSKINTDDVVVSKLDEDGNVIGSPITNGVGFKVNVYEDSTLLATLDATTAKQTSSAIFNNKDISHSYTLTVEMANPNEPNTPWVSDPISITLVENIIYSITSASATVPEYEEYVAYIDQFTAWTGTFNIAMKDGGNRSNRATTVKYYDSNDTEVQISSYLSNGYFTATEDNLTLKVRIFDSSYVGKNGTEYYPNESFNIYVYIIEEFKATDPSGDDAEYQAGATVALNPNIKIGYLDKDAEVCYVSDTSADMLNFYISEDGENYTAYTGTMPSTPDVYTIKATLKTNETYSSTYDIEVVDSTLTVTTSKTTAYSFGESFDKSVLTVKLDETIILANDYVVLDGENEVTVIKFIGKKTLTVRYLGYEAELKVTATNVGSTEANVHDDIPGEWTAGESEYATYQSASNTCTAKGQLLEVDGFDYGTVASNSKYNALLNGSSVIGKNVAFNNKVVKSLTLSFNTNTTSAAGDASFAFTVAAIINDENHTVSTTYVVTSQSYKLTTTSQTISLTLNNMAYTDNITGWYLTVSKTGGGTSAPNAQFYSLRVDYTPYVKGPDQKFNATPFEQALVYSNYFLEITSEYCTVALTDDTKSLLATEYAGMVDEAETIFKTAEIVRGKDQKYENAISEALSRYVNMVEQFKTGDFLNLGDEVINQHVPVNPLFNGENSSMVAIVVIVSVVSLTAIGGYFFLKKRREQN